jgi:hypothetical protein
VETKDLHYLYSKRTNGECVFSASELVDEARSILQEQQEASGTGEPETTIEPAEEEDGDDGEFSEASEVKKCYFSNSEGSNFVVLDKNVNQCRELDHCFGGGEKGEEGTCYKFTANPNDPFAWRRGGADVMADSVDSGFVGNIPYSTIRRGGVLTVY